MRAPPPEGRYRARRIEPEPAKLQGRARKTGAIPNPNDAFKALWRGTSRRLIGGPIGTHGMVESCRAESRFRARNASNAAHRAIWLHLAARLTVFFCGSRSYLGPAYARIAEASTSFPIPPEGPDSGRRVSPLRVSDPPQGGPIGCSPPHAPLEGSFHVWPWGSLDTPPRGLSHATPLGGCCLTVRDPSPAHAGGSCHP